MQHFNHEFDLELESRIKDGAEKQGISEAELVSILIKIVILYEDKQLLEIFNQRAIELDISPEDFFTLLFNYLLIEMKFLA